MRKLLNSRTFWQVFGTAVISSAIVLIVISVVASSYYEKKMFIQQKKEHNRIAQRISKEMELFFEQVHQQLRLAGNLLDVLNLPPERIGSVLNEIVLNAPHFSKISFVNSSGIETATSEPREPGVDFSKSPALKNALLAEQWISPITFNQNRVAYLSVSVPMFDLAQPIGFLIAELSLKKLWWWIDEINTLSNTRLSIVETKKGLVVADQLKNRLGRVHPFWSKNSSEGIVTTSDRKKFVVYHSINGVPLAILTESTMKTFSDQLLEMQYSLLMVSFSLLFFSVVVAAGMAIRSSKPLQSVVGGIAAYGKQRRSRIDKHLPNEYGQIAEAFNEMADEIEKHEEKLLKQENVATIGRTVAGVSHEIRHGFTRILNLLYDTNELDSQVSEKVKTEIMNMNNRMKQLLEFSRAGKLEYEQAEVNDILFMAKEQVRYEKAAIDSKILLEDMPESIIIRADAPKLTMAISNLIRNSLETEKKGITIRLSAHKLDGIVELRVSDDGPGIPDDVKDMVFEPFYTSKAKGFGLGLSLIDTIAKAHGGKTYIASNGKEGTEIRIAIPITEPMDD